MIEIFMIVFPALCMQAIGLILPGPDFVMILNSAITQSKRYTYTVALGICAGMLIHTFYSLCLLPLLIHKSHIILQSIRYLGSFYLAFISIQALKAGIKTKPQKQTTKDLDAISNKLFKHQQAFLNGLLCNVLNPKTIMFYITIFTIVISIQTNYAIKFFCATSMFLMGLFWFFLLAYLLTKPGLQIRLNKFEHIHKVLYFVTSVVFMFFAILFMFSSL